MEKFPWRGNERVLDVGCGDGKITAIISKKYTTGPVVGIDLSPKMVAFASAAFQDSKLIFQEGDIASLPFKEQFDLAVSFSSFHYVIDQEKGVRSIAQSLCEGGKFLCVVPYKTDTTIFTSAERLMKKEKWKAFFPAIQKQRVYQNSREWKELLDRAGFEVVAFSESPNPIVFSGREAFIDWLRPVVNFISHLPMEAQEEFLLELSEEMLEPDSLRPEGAIQIHSALCEFLCQKR
ncbi:MAG: class I SAM-dependent methyltransferase [Parachlamydiales bacterium]|nr:class I SAM-dependent methyltransferase [Parachlamydiales bacterium]